MYQVLDISSCFVHEWVIAIPNEYGINDNSGVAAFHRLFVTCMYYTRVLNCDYAAQSHWEDKYVCTCKFVYNMYFSESILAHLYASTYVPTYVHVCLCILVWIQWNLFLKPLWSNILSNLTLS